MASSLFYGLLLVVTLAVFVAAQDDTESADTDAEVTDGGNSGASSGGALSQHRYCPVRQLLDGLKAVLGYIYAPIAKIVSMVKGSSPSAAPAN
ncbi:hypothetical protein PRIPAC_78898 [Pristionchus pacificus]|uniref:Uncharacterized protein n=1 Tax=Pristionchus pacificus TaxID=54126 RepID=A0A454Y2R2_PRIPA|nr:hypothetical protein PRIPAC_78898 [Pristionchus pacificus]|eukprot:PDM78657.1 hypothetical protein PRIPAC_31236 [Pristionchus pacificus]